MARPDYGYDWMNCLTYYYSITRTSHQSVRAVCGQSVKPGSSASTPELSPTYEKASQSRSKNIEERQEEETEKKKEEKRKRRTNIWMPV
ncbi:hypothetical protein B0I35DRAFT_25093 [Stachybotrys elegans]|uniref:Uncharacterized protein n=1 Tax=Stachybotrys elegans TaxID=80388 RepID=A0A8K0T4J9_9HYPO|nr:hypothetical protein B0I35DRAFT_25093 [Stachybotrys elegans]